MIIGGFWKIPAEVLTQLQAAGPFSETPQWSRRGVFYFDDVDDTQLQVVVAPVTRTLDVNTRANKSYLYRIGAFVIKQIHASTPAARQTAEDGLLTFTDELQDALSSLGSITVDSRSLDVKLPDDEQSPFIAEAYRTAKRFVGVAEVDVYDR